MVNHSKIATCSYCQSRVLLHMQAGSRHELICSSCGAPLQKTEILVPPGPSSTTSAQTLLPKTERPEKTPDRKEKRKEEEKDSEKYKFKSKARSKSNDNKKRRKKKRKGLGYWIREAIDEIEDFFD